MDMHLEVWNKLPEEVTKQIQFIIIDDGSDPALDLPDVNLNLLHYKINEDIPWNVSGAKNLGAHVATTEWIFVCDIDYFLDDIPALLSLNTDDLSIMYLFNRNTDKFGEQTWSTFLMSKNTYWEHGGFDEGFAGNWAYEDVEFCCRMMRCGVNRVLVDSPRLIDQSADGATDIHPRNEDTPNSRRLSSRLDKQRKPVYPFRFTYDRVKEYKLR